MRDLKPLAAWLALAIVLVSLVEIVPSSNRFVIWTLGLVLVYLVLSNYNRFGQLVDSLVRNLNP